MAINLDLADTDLAHLQPAFYNKVRLWLNDCAYENIHIVPVETIRSYARQNWLYAQGRTRPGDIVTKARAGSSYHAFGLAGDFCPTIGNVKGGKPNRDFGPFSPTWQRAMKLAKLRGLRWGGTWPGKFKDWPHLEDAKSPPLWMLRLKYPHGYIPKGMAA